MKLVLGLIVGLMVWAVAFPAEAAFCRTVEDQRICIVDIKRSAKYYWEYRVALSVDGVAQPIERYDCRERVREQPDGTIVRFDADPLGDFVCGIVQRRSSRT